MGATAGEDTPTDRGQALDLFGMEQRPTAPILLAMSSVSGVKTGFNVSIAGCPWRRINQV